MKEKYILSLDAGTTSSRAILFDRYGGIVGTAQKEFPQLYPNPGWVEHDPVHIWETQYGVAEEVLAGRNVHPEEVAAIGITNQRETALVWDRRTGEPVYNAIVWQDRRTASICEELKEQGREQYIRENTGLVVDAYFSATKIAWMLRNVEGCRKRADKGELVFGTVDTWLLWKLTGGAVHATDITNASRTMLFNILEGEWDETLLKALDIPLSMMPAVKPSAHRYGKTAETVFDGISIPIAGIAGDQQSALFGQTCFEAGMVKSTYGTGCFILMNTGSTPSRSRSGLITTVAWGLDGNITYALEGSVFITGAAIQWLRDEMGILKDAAESEALAGQVEDTGGVYVVPAFTGLGAPYWDMYARGTIVGLTRGTGRNHIVRAVLESQAYQVRDVIDCMTADSSIELRKLMVDGGASVNNFLMQFQADILGVPVVRPKVIEATARGAAFLAGLAAGFWKDQGDLVRMNSVDRVFTPVMTERERARLYGGWRKGVERSRGWEEPREI